MIKKIIDFGGKFIAYKIGIAGAIFMACIVFGINYFSTYDTFGSFTAAIKQGGYTFFLGGSFMKGCEYLATKIKRKSLAILSAIIIPSVITIILTFNVHKLKGTPKPLESTIPTLLIIPATVVWAVRKRNQSSNFKS